MRVWLIAAAMGVAAGTLVPLAWALLLDLRDRIDTMQLDPLWGSILIPFLVGAVCYGLLTGARALRTADGFTYFFSELHYNEGRRNGLSSFVHGIVAFLMLLGGGVLGLEAVAFEWISSLGSRLGEWFRMPTLRLRTLMACGLTAGLAATLNQPATALLFSVELLYGWTGLTAAIGPLALTAFLAAGVSGTLVAPGAWLHMVTGTDGGIAMGLRGVSFVLHGWESIYAFAAISLCAAAMAIVAIWLFTATDRYLNQIFASDGEAEGIQSRSVPLRFGLWAALTAFALYRFPEVAGVGVTLAHASVWGSLPLMAVVAAFGVRLVLGAFTYAAIGTMGLVLPTLILGALLGAGVAALLPFEALAVAPVTLLGMGAFLAAAFGVPVTATALVFSFSGGLISENGMFLFVSIGANFAAHFLTGLVMQDRLVTMGLHRHGIRFRSGMCFNTLSSITVKDAMLSWVKPIPKDASIGSAYKTLMESRFLKLPVADQEQKLSGVLSPTSSAWRPGRAWARNHRCMICWGLRTS